MQKAAHRIWTDLRLPDESAKHHKRGVGVSPRSDFPFCVPRTRGGDFSTASDQWRGNTIKRQAIKSERALARVRRAADYLFRIVAVGARRGDGSLLNAPPASKCATLRLAIIK